MDEVAVRQKARSFIARIDLTTIRDDLSPYLAAANAKLRAEELAVGESGFTVTKASGRSIVTVNGQETRERQRFTICHEIAHIVLGLPSSHEEVPAWSYAKRHINEIACDTFASELLMPYQLWLPRVPEEEPSIEVIQEMAEHFGTSFPAAASRYASLSERPCAFVTMERGGIRYAARSTLLRQVGAWISPRSTIPSGSVAYRLRAAGKSGAESDDVAQDIWFDNWERGLQLTEISRNFAGSDTTTSLLWFDAEELPTREVDRFGARVDEEEALSELTGELSWSKLDRRR